MTIASTIPNDMAADEFAQGHAVVRPGDLPWLPKGHWHPDTVCSVTTAGEARLVLLRAKVEQAGHFRTMIGRIKADGLKPVVVEPLGTFKTYLETHGWMMEWRGAGEFRCRVYVQMPVIMMRLAPKHG